MVRLEFCGLAGAEGIKEGVQEAVLQGGGYGQVFGGVPSPVLVIKPENRRLELGGFLLLVRIFAESR